MCPETIQLENSLQALKKKYIDLKKKIDLLPSSCVGVSLPQILSRFICEHENCTPLFEHIRSLPDQFFKEGVLLHDLSGIGLYSIGPMIVEAWASGSCLQTYKAVILFPIERHHLFPIQAAPTSFLEFLRIWNIDFAMNPEDILIVVSGHSGKDLRANVSAEEREKENRLQINWLEQIEHFGLQYVIVSTQRDHLTLRPKYVFPISLQPFDLGVQHLKGLPRAYTLQGKAVLKEAQDAINQTLFKEKAENTIRTTPEWHKEVIQFRSVDLCQTSRVTVPHIYEPIRIQNLIRFLAESFGFPSSANKSVSKPISLSSPSEWFCAAIMHQTTEGQHACYRIGNYLVVRNLSCHYIAVLPNEPLNFSKLPGDISFKKVIGEMPELLPRLINHPDFEVMSASEIVQCLEEIKKKIGEEKSTRTVKWRLTEEAFKDYKSLLKLISKQDPATYKYREPFFKQNKNNITYRAFQSKINEEIIHISEQKVTQVVRAILRGENQPFESLTAAIAATFFAETYRYEISFLAMLCLLDLVENDVDHELTYWKSMFAHSQHDTQESEDSLTDAIVADIAHLLGGYQAMSHGNSQHQTDPANLPLNYGVHWVDFKINIILICWLSLSFEREKSIHPHLTGTCLSRPFVGKPIYIDSHQDIMHAGVGFSYSYLFDRFVRRLLTFDYMLKLQSALRDLAPLGKTDIEEWLQAQQLPKIARIRYPNQQGDPLRIMAMTPFGELFYAFFYDQLRAKDFTMISLAPIAVSSCESIHPLSTNNFFYTEPVKVREFFLTNALLVDPEFYQLYFLKASMSMFELGDPAHAVGMLEGLKEVMRPECIDYDRYHDNADRTINCYKYLVSLEIERKLSPIAERRTQDWELYLVRAQMNIETHGPPDMIVNDLKLYLNGVQDKVDVPVDLLEEARLYLAQYDSIGAQHANVIRSEDHPIAQAPLGASSTSPTCTQNSYSFWKISGGILALAGIVSLAIPWVETNCTIQ